MMRVYGHMDSSPYQRNQNFSIPQYHNPGFGAEPHVPFEPWPYGGNYDYPMPCHSCCNHNNGLGYTGFRPSYPHPSMPSPIHFGGAYPAPYYEPYHPVHYVPPQPHYSMENMRRSYHCYGCPNHSCYQNVDKDVKIEEQGPDVVEKRKADDSLSPAQVKNYPYPIVWIPPESVNGREQRKVSEPEIIEEEKHPTDFRPPESLKSREEDQRHGWFPFHINSDSRPPQSLKSREGDQRHGWFPFDINSVGTLMQGGNQDEDKRREFPFPIFWMPSRDEVGKKDKDVNAFQNLNDEDHKNRFPFPFILLPCENKQKGEGGKEGNGEANTDSKFVPNMVERSDVKNETRVNEEKLKQKIITAKQVDPKVEKNSEETEKRRRTVPVKQGEDNVANKPSGAAADVGKLSSPKKSFELPPVCLRVDPFPRKKKGNGGSRSPSPPSQKGVEQESSTNTTKVSASLDLQESTTQDSKFQKTMSKNKEEVEPSKKEKLIEVVDRNIGEAVESERDGRRCGINEDQRARKAGDKKHDNVQEDNEPAEISKSVADGKLERKTLSDVEAAVLIQSAYRGFQVRKWEPLKKLKQIAELRKQVADVRNRITSLEISDMQKVDKERVIIGETIMSLLLKLDTIQGLLPSLRDIRRSLARELVLMQEKLDDLMVKKSQDSTQEASTLKPLEGLGPNANNNNSMLEQKDKETMGLGEGPDDGTSDSGHDATEPCQGQVLHTIDSVLGLRTEEPHSSDNKEVQKVSEEGCQELEYKVMNGQFNAGDTALVDEEMGNGPIELEQCGKAPSSVEVNTDHRVARASSEVDNVNPETRGFKELPRRVSDNEHAISEPQNDAQVEMSKSEAKKSGEAELQISQDVTSPSPPDDDATATGKEEDMSTPTEVPHNMIDEHSAANDAKMTEKVEGAKKGSALQNAEGEAHQIAIDETPNVDQLEEEQLHGEMEKPIVQAEEWEKVEPEKEEGHPDDSMLVVEETLKPHNEVDIDNSPLVSESSESQALSLPLEKIDDTCTGALAVPGSPIEDGVQPVKDEPVKVEIQSTPVQKSEPSPEQSFAVEKALPGKLIEENEKLRDMMQKLMEAGNEQLQVISSLTGRVKDLEKKLVRKRKVRTRRSRAASPANNHLKKSAAT